MRLASRIFFGLGIASLLAGGLFFVGIITGTASLTNVILFPIVTAFSLFGAFVCFVLALIFYIFKKRR